MILVVGLVLVLAAWQLCPKHRREGMASKETPTAGAAVPVPGAGGSAAAPAIFNGKQVPPGRFPWFCGLFKANKFVCGGVLVSNRHVLTANHCGTPDFLRIAGGPAIKIKSAMRNPPQGPNNVKNDWLLLELATPTRVKPIKIAPRMPPHMSLITVLGRGKTSLTVAGGKSFNYGFMQYTETGSKEIGEAIPPNIALGLPFVHTCSGDSGSPIIIDKGGPARDELIGIVSQGLCKTPQAKQRTRFIKVPGYLDKIVIGA